jgi:hypothetical protein
MEIIKLAVNASTSSFRAIEIKAVALCIIWYGRALVLKAKLNL